MRHTASSRFWSCFNSLPLQVQDQARKAYELLKSDPRHPSLHFKQVGELWSVRVSLDYRAVGIPVDGGVHWFWIGAHAEYDQLIG